MEDGGLGCVGVEGEPTLCLRLWSRVLAPEGGGVESWEIGRSIELATLLPKDALPAQRLASAPSSMPSAHVVGMPALSCKKFMLLNKAGVEKPEQRILDGWQDAQLISSATLAVPISACWLLK
ncbi:hypothetical protein EJB05_51853, partial [Eragrostis curvula]